MPRAICLPEKVDPDLWHREREERHALEAVGAVEELRREYVVAPQFAGRGELESNEEGAAELF
eukprot:12210043-Alexandrium_andersonii.AAC.1